MGSDFEIVDHTADWAIRVYGADLPELFINAARGMTSLMVLEPESIPLDQERMVELDAFDAETLLVDWLSELAYFAEDELLVFRSFTLGEMSETHLRARINGGRVENLLKHIKAVTYHELAIRHTIAGLETTIVFDV